MSFFPRSPARPDRNSNSAFEKLKFVEEHYEQLMAAYQDIMAHLKLVGVSESGGGECLWEDTTSQTYVPYYITFSDIPKEVADLCFIRIDYEAYFPLYWVSDTTYAMPIPFRSRAYNVSDLTHDTYIYFSGIRLFLPCHFETLDGANYWFQPTSTDLYADNSMHGSDGNHFYITSSIESQSDFWQATQYRNLMQDNISFDDTSFTFNSIKPSSNKQIYLGSNA